MTWTARQSGEKQELTPRSRNLNQFAEYFLYHVGTIPELNRQERIMKIIGQFPALRVDWNSVTNSTVDWYSASDRAEDSGQ